MSKFLYEKLHKEDVHKLTEKMFRARMMTSVLCMIACMVAMLSSAYAWFVTGVSSGPTEIQGAYYSIEVISENEECLLETEIGTCTYLCDLEQEDKHYFALKAAGTASTGYCKVLITEETESEEGENTIRVCTYETASIAQGETLTVCIQAAKGSQIEFIPVWGTPAASITTFSLRRPEVFHIDHSTTPYIEYLVPEGVTLEALAEYYGVSVEDICIYNGISELVAGDVIKIPGIEDDSIEPYMPTQVHRATASNATSSDADRAETSASSEKSAADAKNQGTRDDGEMTGQTPESTGAAEESEKTENSAESESASESESAVESESASESESAPESEYIKETESVTEAEESGKDTASAVPELISEELILPEMSTEDMEATVNAEPAP